MEDLKKALQENRVIIGADRVLKKLRNSNIKKVFIVLILVMLLFM